MKKLELIYYLLIIIFILERTVIRQQKRKKNHPPRKYESAQTLQRNNTYQTGYTGLYTRVPLLTQREQLQYNLLKQIADKKNVLICPKVRLLDLVVPVSGAKNYKALMSKVMSKHVDFAICSQDMDVLGIIELDDSTHLRKDRIDRDAFVDNVLRSAGYQIKHTWNITPDILDSFLDLKLQATPDDQIVSPTGWIWNEETKLWDPPKNIT